MTKKKLISLLNKAFDNFIYLLAALIISAVVSLIGWGVISQCEGIAVYQDCSAGDRPSWF